LTHGRTQDVKTQKPALSQVIRTSGVVLILSWIGCARDADQASGPLG